MANWIEGAIKHPGAFSAKAHKAGKSTRAFASEHADSSGTLGRQARLAKTLMGMHHHATGAVVSPTPQAATQPQLGTYGQPPTQTTPNLYRPGGPINQPPVSQVAQAVTPTPQGPTILNTPPGQPQGMAGGPISPQGVPQRMALGGVGSPTVLNTVQGQRPQVRRPIFGQYPNIR